MRHQHLMIVLFAAFSAWIVTANATGPLGPDITGTYHLVSRDLPDETTVTPPAVVGMLTYTAGFRNFNVAWDNPNGTRTSISYIAEYTLDASEYAETPIYWMSNNLGAEGISYTPPEGKQEPKPVTRLEGRVEFAFPGEPPIGVFDANGMTATARDADGKLIFIDHWKKVD